MKGTRFVQWSCGCQGLHNRGILSSDDWSVVLVDCRDGEFSPSRNNPASVEGKSFEQLPSERILSLVGIMADNASDAARFASIRAALAGQVG